MKNTCIDCKFYELDKNNLEQGFCHINPVTILAQIPTPRGPQFFSGWPQVNKNGWCGKLELKDDVKN